MDFVEHVYAVTDQLPKHETYGLADQLRRASVSIPSNIAEGQRRTGNKEIVHFTSIALGSLAEVETQLILVSKLYKIDTIALLDEASELGRILSGLTRYLRS